MNEHEVMQFFCDKKGFEFVAKGKNPPFVLFAPSDQQKLKTIVGWATVLIKNHSRTTFTEVMIDLLTLEEGFRSANVTGIPFYIVISYSDAICYAVFDGVERITIDVKYGVIGDDPEPMTYAFISRHYLRQIA